MSWLGLDGQTVLIAGAGGLGEAVARGFAEQGASVASIDHDAERLAVVEGVALPIEADLRTSAGCRGAFAIALQQLGSVDVFIHCVGTNLRLPIEEYRDEDFERIVSLNLMSAMWLGQEAARHMRPRGSGSMVFFSSVASILAHLHHGPYAATKGAINQLVRVMANELASAGVTVNAVAPGYVETDLTRDYLAQPGKREGLVALVPAGRLGTTDEVVGPVLFLCSRHAGFVTGQVLAIDGARTCV